MLRMPCVKCLARKWRPKIDLNGEQRLITRRHQHFPFLLFPPFHPFPPTPSPLPPSHTYDNDSDVNIHQNMMHHNDTIMYNPTTLLDQTNTIQFNNLNFKNLSVKNCSTQVNTSCQTKDEISRIKIRCTFITWTSEKSGAKTVMAAPS